MKAVETAMKWLGLGVSALVITVLCMGLVVVLLEVSRRK